MFIVFSQFGRAQVMIRFANNIGYIFAVKSCEGFIDNDIFSFIVLQPGKVGDIVKNGLLLVFRSDDGSFKFL